MGKQGRYGKYGEQKRIARLRESGIRQPDPKQKDSLRSAPDHFHGGRGAANTRIVISAAERSDVGFIRTLSEAVFTRYGPYDTMLSEWFLAGLMLTLKAVMERTPKGFVMLGVIHNDPTAIRVAELVAVAVEPRSQGMGIGDRLMMALLKAAEDRFVEKMILHTAVDNLPAQALFEKHGFVSAGQKEGFYPNGQNALLMTRAGLG